jgi:enamine deaminase RidA (YjgF/YER057c/UK114 family)
MAERKNVRSGSPYEDEIGFSRAVRVGDRVLVSGTAPIWPGGSVDPDPYVQAKRCLEIVVQALAEAGASPEHVVRTRTYLTDASYGEAVARAHAEVFGAARPASTMIVVAGFLDDRWKVECEAEAVVGAFSGRPVPESGTYRPEI